MMNSLPAKLRTLLAFLLVSVTTITFALPEETEYLGNLVYSDEIDDASWGAFPIGFDFDFFGNTYSEFYVTSNGLVMFGSGTTRWTNYTIPTTGRADNYIAPFWDDLIVHNSGDIMYQTIGAAPNRKLVIQYSNMSFYNSTILLGTIQVILYEESNTIQTQYRSIVDLSADRASGSSATIGLENINGSAGVLCSYNTAGYIYSGRAILFSPDGGGSYTYDDDALYDGVILVDTIPRSGTPQLLSPAYGSTVSDTVNFQWEAATNAASYYVVISQNSDLSSPIHTSADLTELSYEYILSPDEDYYWSAYSKNSEGTISWSEIWQFHTSATPPLLSVPQTIYLEVGDLRTIALLFTGGDAGSKTATVTTLPAEGTLYQNSGGVPGAEITTVPTAISDAGFNVIYSASGTSGNAVGDFDFHFTELAGTSADETITVNVSPPGIPNYLFASKEIDRVEITFDRDMTDPTGKHLEFSVQDNGVDVTSISCALKAGDPTTIVLYVSPDLNTANAITVAYTKGTITAESTGILESFDFQLAGKLVQIINFAELADRTYGDADFTLTATASSGLPLTFSSSNSLVVSVAGSTATINNPGETLISATQAGDDTYAPVNFDRHQLVNKITASVTLSDLSQEYTASGIAATVTTAPVGLNVKTTYAGLPDLPIDLGTYAVLAEVVEPYYMGSAAGLLTITDLTAPVPDLATLPVLTDECTVTPIAPTATDLYAGVIVGTTPTAFPITAQATTVLTWTYDDGNGNTSTQTQNVIIDDVSDPVPDLATLADIEDECEVTAIAVPTATDNCAGSILGTTTDPVTYNTQGSYMITWTYNDGNGNTSTQTQNVIIDDVSDPVPDLTPLTDVIAECEVSTLTVPTATDNCGGVVLVTHDAMLPITGESTTLITWTFDDGNGNTSTQTQNVIIDDVSDPVPDLATLADIEDECEVTAIAVPTATDNCAGSILGTTTDPVTYNNQGSYMITWTFDDGNGNIVTQTQNVIIDDVSDPVPDLATLADIEDECEVTAIAVPTATDNCAGSILGTTTDPVTYNNQGSYMITWTFDDGNGNIVTQTQNVFVVDVTSPITPNLPDVTGECTATATIVPTTTDACTGIISGTTTDLLTYTTAGTHVINWTFDDGNSNSITVPQNVIITDILDPVTPTLADLTDECSLTAVAPTTTDACAGTITGTTSDPVTYSSQGSYVITWIFDDGNGNSITVPQNVIVADITDPAIPVLADVSGECDVTTTAPTTTDNCAGTITGTTTDPLSYTSQDSYVITWTFDDGNGNSITVPQNVIVDDISAPTATSPGDVVICDGTVSSIKLTDIADNCSIPGTAYELSGATTGSGFGDASASVFNPGVTTVSYTLDDGNGNTSQYSFTVTNNEVGEIVVTTADGKLTVETAGTYQWITCVDSSILLGETASSFGHGVSGEYAVIVTQSGCSDTSQCYTLDYTGAENEMHQAYEVYPNPAHNYVSIRMENEHTNVILKVVDITGKILMVEEMDRLTKIDLDISRFKAGLYLIKIHSDQLQSVARIIKE